MLYLGNTELDGRTVPVVYQDIWGLRTADNSRRAVIGGSVFLPLLLRQISILGMPEAGAPVHEDNGNPAG
jgi:hypothetical protein